MFRIGTPSNKKYGIIWEFFAYGGGGGGLNSQNFCKLTNFLVKTKYVPKVLKCEINPFFLEFKGFPKVGGGVGDNLQWSISKL